MNNNSAQKDDEIWIKIRSKKIKEYFKDAEKLNPNQDESKFVDIYKNPFKRACIVKYANDKKSMITFDSASEWLYEPKRRADITPIIISKINFDDFYKRDIKPPPNYTSFFDIRI